MDESILRNWMTSCKGNEEFQYFFGICSRNFFNFSKSWYGKLLRRDEGKKGIIIKKMKEEKVEGKKKVVPVFMAIPHKLGFCRSESGEVAIGTFFETMT